MIYLLEAAAVVQRWARRLWPYATLATLATLLAVAFWLAASCHADRGDRAALRAAHEASSRAAQAAHVADTVFVHDTVRRAPAVAGYRAARDSALRHLTDTVLVRETITRADTVIALDSAMLLAAAQAIRAHLVYEHALVTELAAANRLRPPRFQVASLVGADVTTGTATTGIEASYRIAERWAVVGRVEQRWAPGDGMHRLLFARYTF